MNFEKMLQRVINAKIKAGLKSSIMIQDSDICYPRGHCFLNNTAAKVQTQKTTVKDPQSKKVKTKDPKSILSCTTTAESFKHEKKD